MDTYGSFLIGKSPIFSPDTLEISLGKRNHWTVWLSGHSLAPPAAVRSCHRRALGESGAGHGPEKMGGFLTTKHHDFIGFNQQNGDLMGFNQTWWFNGISSTIIGMNRDLINKDCFFFEFSMGDNHGFKLRFPKSWGYPHTSASHKATTSWGPLRIESGPSWWAYFWSLHFVRCTWTGEARICVSSFSYLLGPKNRPFFVTGWTLELYIYIIIYIIYKLYKLI